MASELIQVDDDGLGMDAEDAVHCFTRHATSKISALDDLGAYHHRWAFGVKPYLALRPYHGLQLISRCAHEPLGTRVVLAGGTVLDRQACGAPPGTSIRCQRSVLQYPSTPQIPQAARPRRPVISRTASARWPWRRQRCI